MDATRNGIVTNYSENCNQPLPMTIHIVHLVSSLKVGGAEKFVRNLAARQAQRDDLRVSVLSFGAQDDAFQSALSEDGVPVINVSGSLLQRCSQLRVLRQFDVLHIHSPAVIRALAPVFFFLVGKRVVYTIHGEVDPPEPWLRPCHAVIAPFLDHTTAVSRSAQASVGRRYGWSSERVRLVANGIFLPAVTPPLNPPEARLRLGIVSRLIALKNVPLLFRAAAALPAELKSSIDIQVFGDGPERATLEAIAGDTAELAVTFHGNQSDEAAIFGAFDVLLLCSDTEGLPMSIIEAMGYGRAVIATDVGAIATVVRPGETGWLFPARDGEKLAQILTQALGDRSQIPRLGANSRALVKDAFSIDAIADTFQRLYQDEEGPR